MPKPVSETFKFCPNCGSASKTVGMSPFHCNECEYGFYFSPATAVGGIVTNQDDEILFLIRGRDPGKGQYGLPGGFVDANETLEDSLTREVLEETSLKVTRVDYLCSFPNSYTYREVTVGVLDSFYVCEVETFDSLKPQQGEVEGFHIAKATNDVLDNMAFVSNRKAVEFFLKRG
ncbi:MAG: NUDIX domain-containing protein [Mariniblastus sp.]